MDDRKTAGQRLKRTIHIARARADITSDISLSVAAHVSYDTLMNWYGGRTTPRPHELRKVAKALSVSYAELWASYEGHDPEPVPLAQAIREQTAAIRELIIELRQARLGASAQEKRSA